MPPPSTPSTPPTIEESMAKLADSLDKLELIVKHLVAKRLAESTANLVSITSQTTFTTNESNTRLETTLQKLTCQPTITQKESNDSTSNTNTDITDTTMAVVTAQNTTTVNDTTTPPNTQPNIIMPLPNNNGQIHTPTPKNPMAKLLTVSVSSMAKIQNVVPAQIRVPFPSLILDKLAAKGVLLALSIFIKLCFCWLTTFPPDDQSQPKR
ncbi:hypothetical protein Tco_1117701 [Tanacetum coccineum]